MRSDSTTRVYDPFALTTDPSAYFPRLALEAALTELVELIGQAPACAALIGEPGLGKTLLLHVLEERLEGAVECLYVPFPRLDATELWGWVAISIGIGGSENERAAVLERARRRAVDGTGLVLLVDDAGALPPATRSALIQACGAPGLSLVMAFTSADVTQLEELPAHVRRIHLGPPMTLAETRAYVRARLRRVDPEGTLAAHLGPARMAELHEASAGVPARLHALLDAWLRTSVEPRRAAPRPPAAPVAPAEPAPPRRVARPPAPARAAVERQPFFRGRGKRRAPLALALLLVLLLAGFWRFASQREPPLEPVEVALEPVTPAPAVEAPRAEPPPAEPAPAPVAELAPAQPEPAPPAVAAEEPMPAPELPEPVAPDPEPLPSAQPEPAPPAVAAEEPVAPPAPAESAPPEIAAAVEPAASPPAISVAPASEAPAATPAPVPQAAPPLAPAPAGPRLSVNAEPWAEIQLDGRPVGETPLGDLPLSPGTHRVQATLPDGRVLERSVEARAGDVYLVFP